MGRRGVIDTFVRFPHTPDGLCVKVLFFLLIIRVADSWICA